MAQARENYNLALIVQSMSFRAKSLTRGDSSSGLAVALGYIRSLTSLCTHATTLLIFHRRPMKLLRHGAGERLDSVPL